MLTCKRKLVTCEYMHQANRYGMYVFSQVQSMQQGQQLENSGSRLLKLFEGE